MINKILLATAITVVSAPVMASNYDNDVVTFSASSVCTELVGGFETPTKATDKQWANYLKCIEVMHYFNTKY